MRNQTYPNRISFSVKTPFNPFSCLELSPWISLYRFTLQINRWFPGLLRTFLKFVVRIWGKWIRNTGREKSIEIALHIEGERHTFRAHEANTQLQAIYLKRYQQFYEPDIESVLAKFLPSSDIFIDGGANWGYFTGLAAKYPELKIMAFEPNRYTFEDLESLRKALPSRYGLIKAYNMGLSEHQGRGSMVYPEFETGLAQVVTTPDGTDTDNATNLTTIDSFALHGQILIKLDVEGHELKALKGARSTLAQNNCIVIFEHWTTKLNSLDEFIRFFLEINYRVFKIDLNITASVAHATSVVSLVDPNLEMDRRFNLLALSEHGINDITAGMLLDHVGVSSEW